ncbi:MAG: hypothetical protein FJ291_23260 [Planctomycetes bacterium]|nr:hypothetical protein [Planctomycetota bacterium]
MPHPLSKLGQKPAAAEEAGNATEMCLGVREPCLRERCRAWLAHGKECSHAVAARDDRSIVHREGACPTCKRPFGGQTPVRLFIHCDRPDRGAEAAGESEVGQPASGQPAAASEGGCRNDQ